MEYYPYGECRNSTGTIPTDKKFNGQRLDDTGLYYYGARYYDPTIGRFISADTIIPSTMNPQAFNRYSYVLNNPLRYTDPTGCIVQFVGTGSLLQEAWTRFRELAPNVATALEDSEQVISISWTPTERAGSVTLGDERFGKQLIMIDRALMESSVENVAAIIAHEAWHAKEGRQTDSVQEEMKAYRFEYIVGNALGLSSSDGAHAFATGISSMILITLTT